MLAGFVQAAYAQDSIRWNPNEEEAMLAREDEETYESEGPTDEELAEIEDQENEDGDMFDEDVL